MNQHLNFSIFEFMRKLSNTEVELKKSVAYKEACSPVHAFYKQRLFSTQPQCWSTFSWIELQMSHRCYLIQKRVIILRQFLYSLYLCPYLDLGQFFTVPSFMSCICDVFFIFIFIFITINRIISWIRTHLLFCLFFRICTITFPQDFLQNRCT